MSNGVEVIVRGRKTALIGFDNTPWLPHRVSPSRPVTLPAHTVSRQFHLVEKPGRPHHNAVGELLQSIVRSATPDMVTKTMVTTFTYFTTVLKHSNTIVKSREEIISNVQTQKFRATMEYTPSVKSVPSSLPPDLLASLMLQGGKKGSGVTPTYFTDTLTTTYIYYNTFTSGVGLPVVLTSRETVSNLITLPAYLSPSSNDLMNDLISSTRVFETETYYSTYTFSKTMLNPEQTNQEVVTTKETVTQVVVTEALLPRRSSHPDLLTPLPPMTLNGDEITKIYLTTFTHLFTEVGVKGQLVIRSSTSIASETVTETFKGMEKTLEPNNNYINSDRFRTPVMFMNNDDIVTSSPAFVNGGQLTTTISETKTLTPVLLYATKVYYTTYTYFTTVRNKEGTGKPARIHSRTQVVSRVVTEALSTAFDANYVAQLKSSYLSKHSTLLDITSSIKEIIPTKTIDYTEIKGTLVTQQVFHPHWPKDDEQLSYQVDPTTTSQPEVEVELKNTKINTRPSTISSSEEHFDEVKEGVHKIVSVLTNTKVKEVAKVQEEVVEEVVETSYLKPKPEPTKTFEYLYSTATPNMPIKISTFDQLSPVDEFVPFQEEQRVTDEPEEIPDFDDAIPEATAELDSDMLLLNERPSSIVSHMPTPPLLTRYTTKPSPTRTKKPVLEEKTELDQFPDIGPKPIVPKKSILVDYPSDIMDYSDDIFDDASSRFGFINSNFQASSTLLGKRTGTAHFDQMSSYNFRPQNLGGINPSSQLFDLSYGLTSGTFSAADTYEEEVKDESTEEEIAPPKIYNIPAAFDSNTIKDFSKQQFILDRLNKTNVIITRKSTEKPKTTTTTTETPVEMEEVVTFAPETDQEEPEQDLVTHDDENAENAEKDTETAENDAEEEEVHDIHNVNFGSSKTNETDEENNTEMPTDLPDENTEKDSSTDTLTKELEDLLEKTFANPTTTTTVRPKKQKTRYTTQKRPMKKGTRRPITFRPAPNSDEEESEESSTKVYNLKPIRFSEDSGESVSEEADLNDDDNDNDYRNGNKNKKNNNKYSNTKDSDQDEGSSESYERRPADVFHGPPTGPTGPTGGGTGPSKSGLTLPAVAGGTAAVAATGINWKPLLNLGAIGLGGLGASSLTKLGPLFNSVAGYMKGALLPIARNDTQHGNSYSKKSQRGNKRPNYLRQPPKETPMIQHMEPNYIPLGNGHSQNNPNNNYRFSDERIPRRPVISHANEPNFRPIAADRDPDLIAGPLPPPIHFNMNPSEMSFPPTHNYNFQPPNDHLPNIYTQITGHPNNNNNDNNIYHNKNGHPPPPQEEDSSPQNAQNIPNQSGPEGKTEFILKPLQNLMNGRPMFPDSQGQNSQGQGQGQRNPGKITPVLRPMQLPEKPLQRPVYRPRPGPASIEMINEIKDSQRQPFDPRPNNPSGQIILPHRKPTGGPPPPPTSIKRPPFPNVNLPLDGPWGIKNKSNPPKLNMEHLANSDDSFEKHFAPGAQHTFFNQPGFITGDHFDEFIATPPPFGRINKFNSPGGANSRPQYDGPSPTFEHPVRAQEIPFPPQVDETQASEESINHAHHSNEENNAHGPDENNDGMKMEGPPGENDLVLYPHNGQNQRPFRPIQSSHEGFESQRVPELPLHPPNIMANSEESHPPLHRPPQNPPPRNNNNFGHFQGGGPSGGRFPANPIHSSEEDFDHHHSSAENVFHQEHSLHSRPPPTPWANNNPAYSNRFPGPINNNPMGGHSVNGNQQRFPGPVGNQERFPGPGGNQERFPGPGGNQERFPGHEENIERFPENEERFPGPPNFDQNENSNRFPIHVNENQPRPPAPLPMPPLERPTQHFPPFRQNPSTVYIVEEVNNNQNNHNNNNNNNNNNHNQEHESEEENYVNNHNHNNNNNIMRETTPEPFQSYSHEENTQYPKLIIKEVPTRPVVPFERRTTTISSLSNPSSAESGGSGGNNPTTNRGMISRLFIRRFKSTTTTPGPIEVEEEEQNTVETSTAISPWLHSRTRSTTKRSTTTSTTPSETFDLSPTMNDLMNFEQRFKQKYGSRRPNPSNRFDGKINITDKSFETSQDTEEYSAEEDEFKSPSNNNHKNINISLGIEADSGEDHPNHHPVHKPPIDVTKYLTDVNQDEFGQLYQGTEDQDTIIDPVNQQVIKSPFDTVRRNISNFMRRSTTTMPPLTKTSTTTQQPSTLSSSEEDKFLDRFTVPEGIFTSTPPAKSKLWWPTTFRPNNNNNNRNDNDEEESTFIEKITPRDQDGPTTFRGDAMGPTTYRPGNIFTPMKNDIFPSNINNNNRPSLRPAPQAGMASFYDDEDSMDQIKIKNSEIHKLPPFLSTGQSIKRPGGGIALVRPEDLEEYESSQEKMRDKLNKASESHKVKEYLDASSEEEEGSSEFPSTKLRPPLQRPGPSGPFSRPPQQQPPPQQSQRPRPFETLTNFFRKPPLRNQGQGPPSGNNNVPSPLPGQRPFIPQRPNNIQIVRPQQPPTTTTPRPLKLKIEYTPHNFNNKPMIPLNPNIKTTPPTPPPTTQTVKPDEEGKDNLISTDDTKKSAASSQETKVKIPDADPEDADVDTTGNGHRESSYMYDSEYYEDDDEEPTDSKKNNVIPPTENLNRPQQTRPQLMRPLNVGGHLVNSNNRPQFQRPIPPIKVNNRPLGIFDSNLQHPSRPLPPNSPKTEMEPPPIDSNRLKPPVLELPSSGPIRYRPTGSGGNIIDTNINNNNNHINRPNLLRPDEDFFKPPDRRPVIHTIASVDENNKILGTNTFTAILPSKSTDFEVQVKATESLNTNLNDINPTEFLLEGSEASVVIPSHSSGANMRMSSVIKYTGGRLETSLLSEVTNSSKKLVDEIQPTKSTSTLRGFIQRTRGPSSSIKNTNSSTSSPISVSSSTSSSTNSSSSSSQTNRYNILNRRPIQITRLSSTSKSPTISEGPITSTVQSVVRRPFIPTRGPGPNIVPWARRTQSTSTTTTTTTGKPSTHFNNNRTHFNPINRRPTSTFKTTSTSSSEPALKTDESKSNERIINNSNIKPTTFRPPFRKPGSFEESSEEEVVTTINPRFVPAKRPTTEVPTTTNITTRKSIFKNVTSSSSDLNKISSSPSNSDSEYEEYSEEYEDDGVVTQIPDAREVSTKIPTVTTVINPTRTNPRGNTRFKNANMNFGRPKPPLQDEETTRYITYTESSGTITVTETETSVFSSRGTHRTQTVIITKTQPPQTLISTIVGTLTLVNTVDVRPTTVRTTIFSEPTKAVYTFVDTSERSDPGHDDSTSSTEKVLLGGIITAGNRPRGKLPRPVPSPPEPGSNIIRKPFSIDGSGCGSNCSLNSNQACRSFANGTRTKCDCKPGYARMKPKYPCRPTFTYEMSLGISHMDGMSFDFKDLYNAGTEGYLNFITVTKEAIDKAFLATDIKRQFQGTEIIRLHPVNYMKDDTSHVNQPKVDVDFLVQLTTNITEDRIRNHLIRTLKASNFSVGRTGISSTRNISDFSARDFNECLNKEFQDCSPNAECLNVRGSFTCKCNPGYKDKSSKRKPGRDCHETSGCKECNFHGTCHTDSQGNPACHCFKWYGGIECQINLKFLLIAITGIGSVLFLLVLLCGTLVCKRSKISRGERAGSGRFMRYRSPTTHSQATLERTAIMNDSASSDGGQSPHPITHSFTPDSLLIDVDPKGPPGHGHGHPRYHGAQHQDVNLMNFSLRNVVNHQQTDRSLTVVIPRAKIRPPSRPSSRHAAIGPDTNADLGTTERKLISYLDQSSYSQAMKPNTSRQSTIRRNDSNKFRKFSLQEQRKISQGALVSSGIEVSAMGGMRRKSTTGLEPESPYTGYEKSVSEVRSFGETIRSPAKHPLYTTDTSRTSRTSCYSCKPPSYCGAYSESHGHTMGDKDGASTVYTTQGKLFRMAHDGHDDDTCSTVSSQ